VLYELATFRHPFVASSPKALASKVMNGKYLPITGYSSDLQDLVAKMLGEQWISVSVSTDIRQLWIPRRDQAWLPYWIVSM
jgi:hypothetical protein